MSRIVNFVKRRTRVVITFSAGIVATALLPAHLDIVTRALIGWDIAVWFYLVLMAWMMFHANHHQVCRMAQQEDENALAVLVLLSLASVLSLLAIVQELAGIKGMPPALQTLKYMFTGITVLGSWLFLAVIFSFHYAFLFYNAPAKQAPLGFPEEGLEPDFWDFLYFSLTIAVAAQTSDVSVSSRQMRKTVLAQSVLSFFFNLAILGFSINIAAGLVGS